MAAVFSADEVLEMALQIERNGAAFYRRAAQGADDPDAAVLLRELGKMEEEHESLFRRLRERLPAGAAPRSFTTQTARWLDTCGRRRTRTSSTCGVTIRPD